MQVPARRAIHLPAKQAKRCYSIAAASGLRRRRHVKTSQLKAPVVSVK